MRRVLMLACAALIGAAATAACQGNVFSLKVGDCFNNASADATSVSDVPITDCANGHDAEVYFIFDYPNAPSDYPGEDAIRVAGEAGCKPQFQGYVGIPFENSLYGYSYLTPTSTGWDRGDHTYDCIIVSSDTNKLVGTAKNSKK